MKNKYTIAFVFWTFLLGTNAQNPVYRVINNLNGLPSNTVYDILQDEKGFIWVTHNKGMSRYDGKTFINIKGKAIEGKALSNLIQCKNKIWCQDFGGKFYQLEGDSLINEKRLKSSNYFVTAVLSKNNEIVSIGNDSVYVFDIERNSVRAFSIPLVPKHLLIKNEGDIKVLNIDGSTNLQVNSLINLNGEIEKVEERTNESVFYVEVIKGKYYGFTKKEYPYLLPLFSNEPPIPILKKGLFIHGVHIIGEEIWISTSTGAYCFDYDFKPKYNGKCFFQNTGISKIIKDRENNYWFCTLNNGLFLVPNIDVQLYSLNNASITALALQSTDNQLLIGTGKNEIYSFDSKLQLTKKYSEEINHEIVGIKSYEKGMFIFTHELSFLSNEFKKIWLSDVAVKDWDKIDDSLYALAYSGGVLLYAVNGSMPSIRNWFEEIKGAWVQGKFYVLNGGMERGRAVCFDARDSTLYAATSQGLYSISKHGTATILFNGKPVLASKIKKINDQIYVATYGHGLMKIENKKTVPFITTAQGLSSDVVYNFYKKGDFFWLVEDGILESFDSSKQVVAKYNHSDGLPKAEINDIIIKDNKVYLATTEGLVVLDMYQNTINRVAPLLALNNIRINGHIRAHSNEFDYFETFENNIDINFSVLSFKGEGEIKVKYQINNGNWIALSQDSRTVSLPALSSGKYSINIIAFNEDGISSKPISYNFSIATPWYKQWFFIVGIIILALYVMYDYFKRRIKLIEKNNALVAEKLLLEQEVQKNILASVKSQMNPHFIFNALNTIQSYIYTNDKENASIYLGKFSDLTRSILDMSNKETITLQEEIKALKLYLDLEKIRFDDTLIYEIKIDEAIDESWVRIPSMLIQPYVENAIKHGLLHKKTDRRLAIQFSQTEDYLHVIIDDNGVGRNKAIELSLIKNKNHESFAIDANRKRLDILNHGRANQIVMKITDKIDNQRNVLGTSVELFIPLHKKL